MNCRNKGPVQFIPFIRGIAVFCLVLVNGCASKSVVVPPPPKAEVTALMQLHEEEEKTAAPDSGEAVAKRTEGSLKSLKQLFEHWKGTRYRYGGLSHKGIDCSGFALVTYKRLYGKRLPRTVREQVKKGRRIPRSSLQAGDLVFFKTGIVQKHVGIYLENQRFMHASRSHGVMISRLDDDYWARRFWQAKRI